MIILKLILMILAFAFTLLWFTKLVTDCVSALFVGQPSEEAAQKDGILRLYLILGMSILWPIIIIL